MFKETFSETTRYMSLELIRVIGDKNIYYGFMSTKMVKKQEKWDVMKDICIN